jgi:hypothetical protein
MYGLGKEVFGWPVDAKSYQSAFCIEIEEEFQVEIGLNISL